MWKKIKKPLLIFVIVAIVVAIIIPIAVTTVRSIKNSGNTTEPVVSNSMTTLFVESNRKNVDSMNPSENTLDIVDTQIHFGPGGIVETMSAMDALGIQTVVVDELWLSSMNQEYYEPNIMLENGVGRPIGPTAQLAAQTYPDRFAYILRIERKDPEYISVIQSVADDFAGKAVRIVPGLKIEEAEAFVNGEYDELLSAVEQQNLPLFLYLPDRPEAIARIAEKFPDLRIIIDHIGLYNNDIRKTFGGAVPSRSHEEQASLFDQILELSKYPNIALKWSHVSENFETPVFPGDVIKPYMRKAIDSFGADRIMWASDFSVNTRGENWSELLYGVKANDDLSEEELKAILGGTARKWLDLN